MDVKAARMFFELTIAQALGRGGVPIRWELRLMESDVDLLFFVEYMLVCWHCYDEREGHLRPIREHERFVDFPRAEEQSKAITDWMIANGNAVPVYGNQSAKWKEGIYPLEVLVQMVYDSLKPIVTMIENREVDV